MKKTNQKELIKVLTIIGDSAKKVLKNVKKKEMLPTSQAEQLLEELKMECQNYPAAE